MMTFAYLILGWMVTSVIAGLCWAAYRAFFPRPVPPYQHEMLPSSWESRHDA